MNHQEICNGKLVIVDPLAISSFKKRRKYMVPASLGYKADVILEDLHDGTFVTLKNKHGKEGAIITQKELTKFLLRLGE